MPVVYLATPAEVATQLKQNGGGLSDTILHIEKVWKKGKRAGYTDRIPEHWCFSKARVVALFK